MTIAPYIPQWLQNRLHKPAPQKLKTVAKKDRQLPGKTTPVKHGFAFIGACNPAAGVAG
jgi:hypothetical protein